MKILMSVFVASLFLTLTSAESIAASEGTKNVEAVDNSAYLIELGGGKSSLQVAREDANTWTCTVEGNQLTTKIQGNNEFILTQGTTIVAQGALDNGKLKLKNESGAPYLDLKFSPEKIKISVGTDPTVWEIKRKEDGLKVKVGETEYGKVKYDSENGKTRAKDAAGVVVAQSKSFIKLSPSLAAYLINNADQKTKAFLAMVLLANSR